MGGMYILSMLVVYVILVIYAILVIYHINMYILYIGYISVCLTLITLSRTIGDFRNLSMKNQRDVL